MMAPFYFSEIRIACLEGYQEGVVALVCGALAICQSRHGDWQVTHVASGRRVAQFAWWDEAAKAATALGALDWSGDVNRLARHGPTVKEVVDRIRDETLSTMVVGMPA